MGRLLQVRAPAKATMAGCTSAEGAEGGRLRCGGRRRRRCARPLLDSLQAEPGWPLLVAEQPQLQALIALVRGIVGRADRAGTRGARGGGEGESRIAAGSDVGRRAAPANVQPQRLRPQGMQAG